MPTPPLSIFVQRFLRVSFAIGSFVRSASGTVHQQVVRRSLRRLDPFQAARCSLSRVSGARRSRRPSNKSRLCVSSAEYGTEFSLGRPGVYSDQISHDHAGNSALEGGSCLQGRGWSSNRRHLGACYSPLSFCAVAISGVRCKLDSAGTVLCDPAPDEPPNDVVDEARGAVPGGGPERAPGPERYLGHPRAMVSRGHRDSTDATGMLFP